MSANETTKCRVIKVYSKYQCGDCEATKRYLNYRKVEFEEINVENDDNAKKILQDKGILQMPYVDAGDLGTWTGFRVDRLKTLI